MVIITVWITILMCAIGAVALYIVKGNSVKSKKVETIKNKFSVILDCELNLSSIEFTSITTLLQYVVQRKKQLSI